MGKLRDRSIVDEFGPEVSISMVQWFGIYRVSFTGALMHASLQKPCETWSLGCSEDLTMQATTQGCGSKPRGAFCGWSPHVTTVL